MSAAHPALLPFPRRGHPGPARTHPGSEEGERMPLFMDVHTIDGGVAIGDVAQGPHGRPAGADQPRRAVPAVLGRRVRGEDLLPGGRADSRTRPTPSTARHTACGRRDLRGPGGVVEATRGCPAGCTPTRALAAGVGAAALVGLVGPRPATLAQGGQPDLNTVRAATARFHHVSHTGHARLHEVPRRAWTTGCPRGWASTT